MNRDYLTNRTKYERFRTAIVASRTFTHNGENDLHPGEIVGIRFLRHRLNPVNRRPEPMYAATSPSGAECLVSGFNLRDFCL